MGEFTVYELYFNNAVFKKRVHVHFSFSTGIFYTCVSESSRGLVKIQVAGLHLRRSDSVCVGWGLLRKCISNRFLGGAEAAATSGPLFEKPAV